MSKDPNAAVAKAALVAATKLTAERKPAPEDYLSTGVTPINLCLTGNSQRGIVKGHVYHLAGRASGGKTFLGRTILAEAATNPAFADYELIYDDAEKGGVLMSTEKFFKVLAGRLQAPGLSKTKRPYMSKYVSDFYGRLIRKLDAGKHFVWVMDSLDALTPDSESKMTDNKAKANSQELRRAMDALYETGSILILVSQARANMNGGPFAPEDVYAGGRALEHYPTASIVLRKAASLRRKHNGRDYDVGNMVRANVVKNRIGGLPMTLHFPFYFSYGIDDIGACIEFLAWTRHWKGKKGDADDDDDKKVPNVIAAPEFDFEGPKDELVLLVTRQNRQRELQVLTSKVFHAIQKAITPDRPPRYG